MRANTLAHPSTGTQPVPAHRHVPHASKVVCIYCYRSIGMAGTMKKLAALLHSHDCIEQRLARQPDAPPPFN